MAKRRKYRKGKLKFKLKKTTVYSIFSFGLIISGLLIFLSFTESQPSLQIISDQVDRYFGGASFFVSFSFDIFWVSIFET